MISSDDLDTMARTVWGEARGENWNGKVAVAHVILNRSKDDRWPDRIAEVCKQPKQFSCWNEGDPNREKLVQWFHYEDRDKSDCMLACLQAIRSSKDPTGGANHYFSTRIEAPFWAASMEELDRIGGHRFFKG